nr:Protease lasA precursor [Kibdelosporangium sp. MJ126-NF4]CTQ94923.1 Protease lasA precursor (EC 3.4.24.-) [Kibdelosporangium sp. MJ126-NF4]
MIAVAAVAGLLSSGAAVAAAPNDSAELESAAKFPTFRLPFKAGQYTYSAGIHSNNGSSGVQNALDLSPSDGLARAARKGVVRLQHCSGGDWVAIDHADGWRTGYYHLEKIRVRDGQTVSAGTLLGNTGNALPCGGSSSGAHVHFTLWNLKSNARAAADTPSNWSGMSYEEVSTRVAAVYGVKMDGKVFGGWKFAEGTKQYSGKAKEVKTGTAVSLPGRFRYAD